MSDLEKTYIKQAILVGFFLSAFGVLSAFMRDIWMSQSAIITASFYKGRMLLMLKTLPFIFNSLFFRSTYEINSSFFLTFLFITGFIYLWLFSSPHSDYHKIKNRWLLGKNKRLTLTIGVPLLSKSPTMAITPNKKKWLSCRLSTMKKMIKKLCGNMLFH